MLRLLSFALLAFNASSADLPLAQPSQLQQWADTLSWTQMLKPKVAITPETAQLQQAYLAQIEAIGFPQTMQGLWVQSGNEILMAHQGTVPMPAASLTKVATTLAVLDQWGADHTFETIVAIDGSVNNGILQGDLIVIGQSDPFFVWEEAIAVGNAITAAGVQEVTGNLVIAGDFAMNYETDPLVAGALFMEGINSEIWSYEAESQYAQMPQPVDRPTIPIRGTVQATSGVTVSSTKVLVRHQSLPLDQILRAMNVYSNNVMAEMLAESLGGAAIVAQKAADLTRVPLEEIQLINGSGLGVENRISPRAATAMLMSLQEQLADSDLNVADLFPVMGRDQGTMLDRTMPMQTVAKTGTLNEVSALAGALPTSEHGVVWFTFINGGWDIPEFRQQQDQLLAQMTQSFTPATVPPREIISSDRDRLPQHQLGAATRNEIVNTIPDSSAMLDDQT